MILNTEDAQMSCIWGVAEKKKKESCIWGGPVVPVTHRRCKYDWHAGAAELV